jgi:hypothetical protein
VLGQSKGAVILAWVESSTGSIVQDAVIHLHVNTGKLSKVEKSGPGRVKASYSPPAEFFPQLAVIAAVARTGAGTVHGWTVLPLWGSGKADVYSRPYASVKVTIGEDVFGPVKADKNGYVSIPVIVPPGIRQAMAGKRKIDLKVPDICRVSAIADQQKLVAGSGFPARMRIYVVDGSGQPAREASVGLETKRGSVSRAEKVAEGVYSAEYRPPARVAGGRAVVTVFLQGDEASRDQVEFHIVPGPPARMALQARPSSYTAGGNQPVSLSVDVFDSAGNPASAELSWQSDIGNVEGTEAAGPGRYRASLSLPDFFGDKKEARIRVLASTESKEIQADTNVELNVAAPKRIQPQEPEEPLEADGRTETKLRISVLDHFGNNVPGMKLSASASEGSVGAVSEGGGHYQVGYIPPFRRKPGRVRLELSSGELNASMEVELLERVPLLGLSPNVGYLTNFGHLNAPYFSGEVSLNLPFLGRGFFFLVECGYYFSNQEASGQDIVSKLWVLPITGALAYRFRVHDIVHLFAAVGGGAYLTGTSTRVLDQPAIERSTTKGGAQASVGAGVLLGPGRVTLQIRYIYAESSGIEEISGNIGGLAILAGYQLGIF